MSVDLQKAWLKFINKIDEIKLHQNQIIKRFITEIAKRKAVRLRKKINKS